jgi:hypothetical protein
MVTFTILLIASWLVMTVCWMIARNCKDTHVESFTAAVALIAAILLILTFIVGARGVGTLVPHEEITRNFAKAKSSDGKSVIIFFHNTNWVFNSPAVVSNYDSIKTITYVWNNYPFNADSTWFDLDIYAPTADLDGDRINEVRKLSQSIKEIKKAQERSVQMIAHDERIKKIIANREMAIAKTNILNGRLVDDVKMENKPLP